MIRETFKVHTYAAAKLQRGTPDPIPVYPVEVFRKTHPALWRAAIQAAEGDVSRIEIINPNEVRVT